MDAAVERTGMYSPRVRKAYADQLLHSLVTSREVVQFEILMAAPDTIIFANIH